MILCFVEVDGEVLTEPSLQALTAARRLGEDLSASVDALAMGNAGPSIAKQLGLFGVSTCHVATDDRLQSWAPEAWAATVAGLAQRVGARVVLAPGTDRGNEVMAHVGARTALPMAANCVAVQRDDSATQAGAHGPFLVTRVRWGGSLLEEARLHGDPKLLTVAPHSAQAEETSAPTECATEEFRPELSETDFRAQVARREERPPGKISLSEARVVVGGGRGVGGPDGFAPLEELAASLGGAVGCSRVVTSQGWRPHSDQVGQTGVRIAPDLYIACGISGAIQHMVGAKGAKRILVINSDPDAPILAHADYAIIGDLHQVVPALVSAVKEATGK